MAEGKSKSKILVIGGTGCLGKFIVEASVRAGHLTFILVRPESAANDVEKAKIMNTFKAYGITVLHGDIYNHESLVGAMKQVDVVISVLGHRSNTQIGDQVNIIAAIKEAGNIKRFLPSEFGYDVERIHLVEPAKSALAVKRRIRQIIRDQGIPHTFICNNFFHGFFLPRLGDAEADSPPNETVTILGDGNPQAYFVNEKDIGTYAIKAADDPRTLNKVVHVRPSANLYSLNQLVSLWEKKIGKTLEKAYVSEDVLLEKIKESPYPLKFQLAIAHAAFYVEQSKYKIDALAEAEATQLYPDIKYITVEEYFEKLYPGSDVS